MNGSGQSSLIAWISAATRSGGLTLYRGVRRIELAQKSHRHGHPRWVWIVSRFRSCGRSIRSNRGIGEAPQSNSVPRRRTRLESPLVEVLEEPRPGGLPLADDDGVAMLHRLLWYRRRVETADHRRDAAGPIPLGQPVRVGRLRRERRDRREVALGQLRQLIERADLVVRHVVAIGREGPDREQREARQRLDRARPVGEPGQGHAELREGFAVGANAAHRDQRDLAVPARTASADRDGGAPMTGVFVTDRA